MSDIIEAKPGFMGFSINLKEIWKRLNHKEAAGTTDCKGVQIVADRFRRLFSENQIPLQHAIQIFPAEFGLTLDQLASDISLLRFLSSNVLDWTSKYFGVQREWLDGSSKQIFSYNSYPKHPRAFIDDIVELAKDSEYIEAFLLLDSDNHDLTIDRQPTGGRAAFFVRGMIKSLNNEHYVHRYIVCSSEWPLWREYLESLLVIGRLIFRHLDITTPIMTVSRSDLKAVWSMEKFPHHYIKPPYLRERHLEDFGLFKGESAKAAGDKFKMDIEYYIQHFRLNEYFEEKLAEAGLR